MSISTQIKPSNFDSAYQSLTDAELYQVSGGMKWERNTKNADVIDARGGQFEFCGLVMTLDINGNPSSVHPS